MDTYLSNRYCACIRCKMNDSMGPALLITFGVMLLLDNITHFIRFGTVIAVVLIVIGGVKLLQGSASTEGHIPPGSLPASAVPPMPPPVNTDTTSSTSEANHG